MDAREFPKAPDWERKRYVKVKAHLKTWTIVEKEILFDTVYNQFIIPNGFQAGTKVVDWEYINNDVHELQHALRLCGVEKENKEE